MSTAELIEIIRNNEITMNAAQTGRQRHAREAMKRRFKRLFFTAPEAHIQAIRGLIMTGDGKLLARNHLYIALKALRDLRNGKTVPLEMLWLRGAFNLAKAEEKARVQGWIDRGNQDDDVGMDRLGAGMPEARDIDAVSFQLPLRPPGAHEDIDMNHGRDVEVQCKVEQAVEEDVGMEL